MNCSTTEGRAAIRSDQVWLIVYHAARPTMTPITSGWDEDLEARRGIKVMNIRILSWFFVVKFKKNH